MKRRTALVLAVAVMVLCLGAAAQEQMDPMLSDDPDTWYAIFRYNAEVLGLEEGRLVARNEYLEAEGKWLLRTQEYKGFTLILMGVSQDRVSMVNLVFSGKAAGTDGEVDIRPYYTGCVCAALTVRRSLDSEIFKTCIAAMKDTFTEGLTGEGEQTTASFSWEGVNGLLVFVKADDLCNMFIPTGV